MERFKERQNLYDKPKVQSVNNVIEPPKPKPIQETRTIVRNAKEKRTKVVKQEIKHR